MENNPSSGISAEYHLFKSLTNLAESDTFDGQGFLNFVIGLDSDSCFRLLQLAITGINHERLSRQPKALTIRQGTVLRMIADGNTDKEIAASLYISPKTVEFHVRNVLMRFGVHHRAEAVLEARNTGLLP